MPLEFGDVVLVPFPFTSQAASKKRPAVIVSSQAYNATKPDVVVMAITSQFRSSPSIGEVWLAQWTATGLIKPSVVKPVFATWNKGSFYAGSVQWLLSIRRPFVMRSLRHWDSQAGAG